MLILLFLTLTGLIVSFGAHFLLLLNIIDPPENISLILNIGLVLLLLLRVLATKNLRQGKTWFYDISTLLSGHKSNKDSCL